MHAQTHPALVLRCDMKPIQPLPDEFEGLPFQTSDALRSGLSRGRVRAAAKERVHHGVRAQRAPRNARELDLAYARCMPPECALSGISALRYWGLPLVGDLEEQMLTHVSRPDEYRAPRGRRVKGSVISRELFDVRCPRGFRVLSPLIAWAQSAGTVKGLDLLVIADAMLSAFERYPGRCFDGPLVSQDELENLVERWGGRRGARGLRRAQELARPGAESPGESRVRFIVIEAGFPEPTPNLWIRLGASQRVRTDLAYPELKIAIEYQGEYHFSPEQVIDDMERIRELRLRGWIVLLVTRRDVRNPVAFLAELRAALASRGRS